MPHRIRGNSGEPLSQPPYGYIKSPENPKRWIIEQEAAEVARKIFAPCLKGYGTDQISNVLEKEKILSPLNYRKEKGIGRSGKSETNHRSFGTKEYLGDIINFKTYSKSYKDKKRCENAKENPMILWVCTSRLLTAKRGSAYRRKKYVLRLACMRNVQ